KVLQSQWDGRWQRQRHFRAERDEKARADHNRRLQHPVRDVDIAAKDPSFCVRHEFLSCGQDAGGGDWAESSERGLEPDAGRFIWCRTCTYKSDATTTTTTALAPRMRNHQSIRTAN